VRLLNKKRRASLCFITRHPQGVFKISPTTIAYFDFEQAVATIGHAAAPPRAAMNSRLLM
jgi:hypothetical protein